MPGPRRLLALHVGLKQIHKNALAKSAGYDAPEPREAKRIGFMLDLVVPGDFDELDNEVANLFDGMQLLTADALLSQYGALALQV